MAAMERVERAAADADVHVCVAARTAACRVVALAIVFSRTKRASMRTSSRTPSPTTAEISW